MKKSVLIMITLLLVVAIAGVVVYAVGGDKNENEPVSAFEDKNEPAPVGADDEKAENKSEKIDPADEEEPGLAPAGPAEILLEDYWAELKAEREGEPFTIEEIYMLCADLFKTECSISFIAKDSVLYFLGEYTEYGLSAEKTIVSDPENVPEDDIYSVFLASIDLCFEECTNDDGERARFFISENTNAMWTPAYVFASDYGGFGYKNFSDYYYGRQKEESGIHIYAIRFDQKKITNLFTPGARNNLYEEFKAAAIENGVNIK